MHKKIASFLSREDLFIWNFLNKIQHTFLPHLHWKRTREEWPELFLFYGSDLINLYTSDRNLKMVQWAIKNHCKPDHTTIYRAARSGCCEIIELLLQRGHSFDSHVASNAAGSGNLDLLKWLDCRGCEIDHLSIMFALHHGKLNCLEWLLSNVPKHWAKKPESWGREISYLDYYIWGINGGLHILQFLEQRIKIPIKNEELTRHAYTIGNVRIINWLRDRNALIPGA